MIKVLCYDMNLVTKLELDEPTNLITVIVGE